MIHRLILAGAVLLLNATPVAAQSYPAATPGAATSQDLEHSGSLSPRDVVGKRLLDADGAMMGTIERVSADGNFAILRPVGGGRRTKIAMSGLSIGMSSHTVTDDINSSASSLNARNAAKPAAAIVEPVQTEPPASSASTTSTTVTTTTRVQ